MIFKETQRFTQWWLWVILLATVAPFVYGIYKQIIIKEPFGNNPLSNAGLIAVTLFTSSILVLFAYMRLETKIDAHGISMRYVPFIKKNIPWSEVASAKVVKYGFVGYGIRLGSKFGTVYNTKGNKGLALVLQNGKKLCIGTQRPKELEQIISKISHQKNIPQ